MADIDAFHWENYDWEGMNREELLEMQDLAELQDLNYMNPECSAFL